MLLLCFEFPNNCFVTWGVWCDLLMCSNYSINWQSDLQVSQSWEVFWASVPLETILRNTFRCENVKLSFLEKEAEGGREEEWQEILNSVQPILSKDHLHYWSQRRSWTTKCCISLPPGESQQRLLGLQSRIAEFSKPLSWSTSQTTHFDLATPQSEWPSEPPVKMCIPQPIDLNDSKHVHACWMICTNHIIIVPVYSSIQLI